MQTRLLTKQTKTASQNYSSWSLDKRMVLKGTLDYTRIKIRMYVKLRNLFLFFLRNCTYNFKNTVTVISYAVQLVTAVKNIGC